jgi:hypothetical protein
VVALVTAAAALATTTTTDTSRAGNVKASFSYTGSAINARHLHLQIRRAGRLRYDRAVFSRQCSPDCQPGSLQPRSSSVYAVYLEQNRNPDVVLSLYSGGANCCFIDQVFSYDPSRGTYVKTQHDFASAGSRLRFLGSPRRWRFLSADDSFKYLFTDGADSGEPVQIWSFAQRHFTDVTNSYRRIISADAGRWLALFKHHIANGVGFIAAWAADEERLGNDALVQSTLTNEAQRGDLRDGGNGLATGKRFVAKLNRNLGKLGYRH